MILNGWAVVDLFLVGVRFTLALVVLSTVRGDVRGRVDVGGALESGERRRALGFLAASGLLTLSFASWPLFYAVLQSYVPHWPGVMCIYGVTRVGEASRGVSGLLPMLVAGVEWAKPAAAFCGGAWGTIYWVDRRGRDAPWRRWVALTLGLFAIVSLLDCALEGTYLLIPKREQSLEAGCCVGVLEEAGRSGRFLPTAVARAMGDRALGAASLGVVASLIAGSTFVLARGTDRALLRGLPILLVGALISAPLGLLFLRQVLAPRLLHLPYHYCAYDLLPRVPESVAGIVLYALGVFAIGWAGLAAVCERRDASACNPTRERGRRRRAMKARVAAVRSDCNPTRERGERRRVIAEAVAIAAPGEAPRLDAALGRFAVTRRLLFAGLAGYLTSLVLLGVEWFLSG